MSTIINKDNAIKIFKYVLLGIAFILGFYLSIYLVEMFFNIGVYMGTFIRNLYSIVC